MAVARTFSPSFRSPGFIVASTCFFAFAAALLTIAILCIVQGAGGGIIALTGFSAVVAVAMPFIVRRGKEIHVERQHVVLHIRGKGPVRFSSGDIAYVYYRGGMGYLIGANAEVLTELSTFLDKQQVRQISQIIDRPFREARRKNWDRDAAEPDERERSVG